MTEPINLTQKLRCFSELWDPRIVAAMNDHQIKLVKVKGEFVWHDHPSDELFFVIKGELIVQLRDRDIVLAEGELLVVPKGVEHNPKADAECHVLLMDTEGTLNTGDAGSELTAPAEVWI